MSLGLWNAKVCDEIRYCVYSITSNNYLQGQRTRELHVSVPANTASLGLSLQYAPIALAANIWHILDVPVNSPADLAGLIPYSDYILGSPEGSMQGEGALGEIVEDYIGRPLRLYVYNNEYNVTREVTITPSRSWGGQGAIGCTLGYGALHRLPAPLSEPISAPGETMFDGGAGGKSSRHTPTPVEASDGALSNESSYVVPAQMVASSGTPPVDGPSKSSTPTPGPPRGPKKERHVPKNNSFMDDYFKEQEAKSREMDHVPQKAAAGVPPPPKLGAPPKVGETLE